MIPVGFDQQNAVAAKEQLEYQSLPIHRTANEIISCWEFTPDEIAEINRTGKVWLRVMQPIDNRIAPVLLQVASPFEQSQSVITKQDQSWG